MRKTKKLLSLLLITAIVFGNVISFAENKDSDIKWIGEPKIIELKGKKIEVSGKLEITEAYKGNTKVVLKVNGFNVSPNKDGTFSKEIFRTSEIEIQVFTGKDEIIELRRNLWFGDPIITSLVELDSMIVRVGGIVKLPSTVTANMSDGTTKEVNVTWDPNTIDTSSPGEKTTVGTVEGYEGTITLKVIVEEVILGNVQVGLYKDTTVISNAVDFEHIKDSFYLKNKETGEEFKEGTSPWNAKQTYQMKGISEGEYTIHFEAPEGTHIDKIQLGEVYKETDYNPDTNPLIVIDKGSKNFNYVKIILRADVLIKEIRDLEDFIIPKNTTYDEFWAIRPNKAIIIDEKDREHEVDVRFSINEYNYNSGKAKGEVVIESDAFSLPLSVSNTMPPMRLRTKVKVIFE